MIAGQDGDMLWPQAWQTGVECRRSAESQASRFRNQRPPVSVRCGSHASSWPSRKTRPAPAVDGAAMKAEPAGLNQSPATFDGRGSVLPCRTHGGGAAPTISTSVLVHKSDAPRVVVHAGHRNQLDRTGDASGARHLRRGWRRHPRTPVGIPAALNGTWSQFGCDMCCRRQPSAGYPGPVRKRHHQAGPAGFRAQSRFGLGARSDEPARSLLTISHNSNSNIIGNTDRRPVQAWRRSSGAVALSACTPRPDRPNRQFFAALATGDTSAPHSCRTAGRLRPR